MTDMTQACDVEKQSRAVLRVNRLKFRHIQSNIATRIVVCC